ncbi:14505_t:CDS:1 [Entrophospora sp. SA101]|nr:4347_t:CDS:1 [Entrophospora sp. SA101]CAJ0634494.1 14505_t:CDS:1 [Entrophospora sp. SA101]CAJ0847500.1 10748_t:CDS:1 [Entrophospora sp. SA101]CAJ0896993.1 10965_t:CDS:1 [Entrophospora sp. SA101]
MAKRKSRKLGKRKKLPSYTYPPKEKVEKEEKPIIKPVDESFFIRASPVLFLDYLQAKLRADEPPKYHFNFDKEKKRWKCNLFYLGGEWSSENETRKWAKGEAAAQAVLAIYKERSKERECEEVKDILIRLTKNDRTLLPPPPTSPSPLEAFSYEFFRTKEKGYNLVIPTLPTYAKSPIYTRTAKVFVNKDELPQNLFTIQ